MKFFWPIYLFAAVVGTAGVYVAAPLARPYVEPFFGRRNFSPAAHQEQQPAAMIEVKNVAPLSSVTTEPEPSAPAAAAASDEGDEVSPAMNGIYPAARNEKPGWGITFQRTSTYGLDGARLGHVPGGVLLEYRNARVSSAGNMVECVLLENGTPSAPRLVSKKDVCLFTGTYAKLSAKQRSALLAYYTLSGKIGQRKTELLQASAARNPYFSEYNQAYKTYMAHIDKAKALTAQRDKATELDKSRLEDRLREMKVAETALRTQYDALHAKFRAWKQEHANEIAKAENDPDVKRWTQEMAALRQRVPGLAL
jgi:hypothetical protein